MLSFEQLALPKRIKRTIFKQNISKSTKIDIKNVFDVMRYKIEPPLDTED